MRVVLLVIFAACGRVSFDPANQGDAAPSDVAPADAAPDAPGIYGGFANPIVLGVFGSDPQLRNDGLEIWVANQNPVAYDLESSVRATPGDAFPAVTVSAALSTTMSESDPSLTEDGTLMLFISDRGGLREVWQATRATPTQPFGTPIRAIGLEGLEINSIDLLPDGNTIYVEEVSGVGLTRYSRASRTVPFSSRELVFGVQLSFPTVAPDELLMFGNVVTAVDGIDWATRASKTDPWQDQGRFAFEGCDPADIFDADITADGHRLVTRCGGDLVVLSR